MIDSKESEPIADPAIWGRTRPCAVESERLKAQGTGQRVKTIKENSFSPYALRLTPRALNFFCWQSH